MTATALSLLAIVSLIAALRLRDRVIARKQIDARLEMLRAA